MFRFKRIFGGKVSSRNFDNQATELLIQWLDYQMIQIAQANSILGC